MDQVPAYRLYGEPGLAAFPDDLHIELIATRSRVHNWRIRAHRHVDLHQFFLVVAGGGLARIDGVDHDLPPGTGMVLPPLAVHGFAFLPDTSGYVASVPGATLARALDDQPGLRAALAGAKVLQIGPECGVLGLMQAALLEFGLSRPGRSAALTAFAGLIALGFGRAVLATGPGLTGSPDRRTQVAQRYLTQIEQDFREAIPLAERARRLGVAPGQLNRICRAMLGRTAQGVLHDRVVLEARRQLVYTSMTVAEIAYDLGFASPAYFSRFFASRIGTTPTGYRSAVFAAADPQPVEKTE